MIIKKEIYFEEKPYTLTYSDKKVLIKDVQTGALFSSALDDVNCPREYIETTSIIACDDLEGYFHELEMM